MGNMSRAKTNIVADNTKLSGIEMGATADQSKEDIDALGIDAETVDDIDSSEFQQGVTLLDISDGVTTFTLTDGVYIVSVWETQTSQYRGSTVYIHKYAPLCVAGIALTSTLAYLVKSLPNSNDIVMLKNDEDVGYIYKIIKLL